MFGLDCYIILLLSFQPFARAQGRNWPGFNKISNLFVFGDSYSATGFNVSGPQPNAINPLGNPPFPGRTFSNGRNWVDFLTLTYNTSIISAYNLALGGAVVDGSVIPSRFRPFRNQTYDFFLPNYAGNNSSKVEWRSDNTLFASFFGINDITGTYESRNNTTNSIIVESYSNLVSELYAAGARNFLFLNVPAVHRSPKTLNQNIESPGLVELEQAAIVDFNRQIKTMAQNLARQRPDTTVFLYDTFALFEQILDRPDTRPETEGLKNTTGFCPAYSRRTYDEETFNSTCGVPQKEYFWLDQLHPTPPIHNAMASDIASMLRRSEVVSLDTTSGSDPDDPELFTGLASSSHTIPVGLLAVSINLCLLALVLPGF